MSTKEEIYLIGDQQFKLRDPGDFDLDEDDKINELVGKSVISGSNELTIKTDSDDIAEFLKLILVPVKTLPANFSFRKAKGNVRAKIIGDFFLQRMLGALKQEKSYEKSIRKQLKP